MQLSRQSRRTCQLLSFPSPAHTDRDTTQLAPGFGVEAMAVPTGLALLQLAESHSGRVKGEQ